MPAQLSWHIGLSGQLTGWWIIPTLYKRQASPVYPLLLILIAGYSSTERGTIIAGLLQVSDRASRHDAGPATRGGEDRPCHGTALRERRVGGLDQRRRRASSSSRASEIPKWWATSCRTVAATPRASASGSRKSRRCGPRKMVILLARAVSLAR